MPTTKTWEFQGRTFRARDNNCYWQAEELMPDGSWREMDFDEVEALEKGWVELYNAAVEENERLEP